MVTKSEEQVIEKYKKQGFYHIHSGSPDFIFYKIKNGIINPKVEDIDISSIIFCEVKNNGGVLNHEQQIWGHILKKLGLNYKLINTQSNQRLKKQGNTKQYNPNQNKSRQANSSKDNSRQSKAIPLK